MLAVKYKNKIGKSRYDELFEEFGVNNPNSYAYNQYKIYIKTPTETRNNIIHTLITLQ